MDALPAADEFGLLPPGVHPCDWNEFAQRFSFSPRRRVLLDKLRAYLFELQTRGWACEVYIDGSYVMASASEPNDIDVVLLFPRGWNWAANLVPADYNLVWSWSVSHEYELDLTTAEIGSGAAARWVEFFQGVSEKWIKRFGLLPDTRKGLIHLKTPLT